MDLSFVSSSFRFLSLRENNFGSSVGGGFPIPLYGKGKILPNPHGEVSLSKGVLRFDTVSENASYFYSGLSLLLGPSGLFPRLVGPKCLTLDLKTQEGEAEFLGALFRIKGGRVSVSESRKPHCIPRVPIVFDFLGFRSGWKRRAGKTVPGRTRRYRGDRTSVPLPERGPLHHLRQGPSSFGKIFSQRE